MNLVSDASSSLFLLMFSMVFFLLSFFLLSVVISLFFMLVLRFRRLIEDHDVF